MAKRAKTIDLLRVVDLLQEHITPALCRTVFGAVRKTERQRVWTLEALIRFWTAVVLRAPKAAMAALGRDTLVLGDRLYGTADFFAALAHQHCWGVVRRNRQLSLHKLQRLRKRRIHGGQLEDWLVRAGTGASAPRQVLRYIRWRRGGTRYEVLTNVLAPARLSAEEALDLYPYRWSVERMFFDLKEVLNLNRLYAANPNAVASEA